jgi:hypothetical protein
MLGAVVASGANSAVRDANPVMHDGSPQHPQRFGFLPVLLPRLGLRQIDKERTDA